MRPLLPLFCVAALLASDSDYQQFDSRAMLGVNMTPPSTSTQTANGTDPTTGVETQTVYPGTAADRMGIKSGDLITAINGGEISTMNDLRNEVALTGVGGQVSVEVLRNGQKMVLSDTLSEWPKSIPFEPIDEAAERRFRDWQSRRLDRTQQAVSSLRKQVEDVERRTHASSAASGSQGGLISTAQVLSMPASQALSALPAFRLHLHRSHDTADDGAMLSRTVAWDARVLVGSPAPTIF